MPSLSGKYGVGGLFVLLSGLVHLSALFLSGFSPEGVNLAIIGLVYIGLVAALTRGMRWLVYVAFFITAGGAIIALSRLWNVSDVPGWIYVTILGLNLIAAIALFANLWRTAEPLDI